MVDESSKNAQRTTEHYNEHCPIKMSTFITPELVDKDYPPPRNRLLHAISHMKRIVCSEARTKVYAGLELITDEHNVSVGAEVIKLLRLVTRYALSRYPPKVN